MYGKYSCQMPLMPEFELSALADELYEQSEDDDLRLAELMRELPKETGDALCTSNLTNALQAFMYAFGYEPKIDISDLLLLQPSTMLLRGIVIEKVELAELVFGYDREKKLFLIGVFDGEKMLAAFSGDKAYEAAKKWARENCA